MVESTYVMVHIITSVRIQSVTARRQHLATLHVRDAKLFQLWYTCMY